LPICIDRGAPVTPKRDITACGHRFDDRSTLERDSAIRRRSSSDRLRNGMNCGSASHAILSAAERLDHISPLKSVGLHPLKGNRRGQWAITVNGRWRICFRFKGGDAYEVEIVDYH